MEHTFSKGDTVWLTSVDEYGFCGRENHPTKQDIGVLAEVVRVLNFKEEAFIEEGDCDYTVLVCLTYEKEPRFLDLMSFEVTRMSEAEVA